MSRFKRFCLLAALLLILSVMFVACADRADLVKVTFTVDGEIHREYILEYGSGLEEIPDVPQKKGYLGSWNHDDFSEFFKDTTITAVYTKNFLTLTFKVDNLIVGRREITIGQNPSTLPQIPQREGYTAVWERTDFTDLTVDTIIYPIYTPIEFTVVFKSQGNDDIIRKVNYGSSLDDIPAVPDKIGFVGVWDKDDFSAIKQNMVVNAVYTPKTITVNYIGADESTDQTRVLSYGQQLSLPQEQIKEGYIFNGWYFSDDYKQPAANIPLYDDISVYAFWVRINDDEATSADLFEFTALDDGTYSISCAEGAALPEDIILPNSYQGKLVTAIARGAFKNTPIKSIRLPVGIAEIGIEAFYGCQNLSQITFDEYNKLTKIGDFAFYQNTALTSIAIAENIEEIGDYAFYGCSSLIFLDMPSENNLWRIGDYAFAQSDEIAEINISSKIVTIGDYAFSDLAYTLLLLGELNSLESVGKFAFLNCLGFNNFNAPNIMSIGQGAFAGCANLTDLTIIGNIPIVDYFGEESFPESYEVSQIAPQRDIHGNFVYDDKNNLVMINTRARLPLALKTIRFRNGVENIVDNTLNNCVGVHNIYLPSTVKNIGKYAFAAQNGDPNNLMKPGVLSLGQNSLLETIGDGAFYGRTTFTHITLPQGLKRIGNDAFRTAHRLLTVELLSSENLEFVGKEAFLNTDWYSSGADGVVYLGDIALGYKGLLTQGINLVFRQGVKAIAPYAFSRIENIASVNIPQTVITVHEGAFSECRGIKTAVISEGVAEIGDRAFENCSSLTNVSLPQSLQTLGPNVFYGCEQIAVISLYGDHTLGDLFGVGSFNGSYKATQMKLDTQSFVVESDNDAFVVNVKFDQKLNLYGEYPLAYRIFVNNSVDSQGEAVDRLALSVLGHDAAYQDYYETDDDGNYIFSLPLARTEISQEIYGYVTPLGETFYAPKEADIADLLEISVEFVTDYYVPQSLKKIVFLSGGENIERTVRAYAFMNLTSLEEVEFAEGIEYIAQGAFSGCVNLGKNAALTLPSTLLSIGERAFYGNGSLYAIAHQAGAALRYIGKEAFALSGLRSFDFPQAVLMVGENAFYGCAQLATVQFRPASEGELILASGAFADCQSLTNVDLPDRLVALGDMVFADNGSLSSVIIGQDSQLREIGQDAFINCYSLTVITLPPMLNLDNLQGILSGCGGLRTITVYNNDAQNYHSATLGQLFGSQSYGGSYAVEQQGVLYYLPSSLTEINFGGGRISCNFLENVDKVKRVSLEGIWEIGGYAFRNCAGIERIILPDTVAVIGDGAFENCQSLLSIEISPDSQLTDIGSYAFANNWALKEIYLPQGVNAVKNSAFSDCVSLTDISFQAVSRIEDYAFYRCFALNEVNLPAHIEYIGAYAFYDCKQAEFSYQKFDSLAHIGSFAFFNCGGIKYLHAESIEFIGPSAFNGAYNLEELSLPGNTLAGTVFGSAYYENSYAVNQNGAVYYLPQALSRVRISKLASLLPAYAFKDCLSVKDIIFMSNIPPVKGNGAFDNMSDYLKLFAPFAYIEDYKQAYQEYASRIYSAPTDIEKFVFTLLQDDTYGIALKQGAQTGEVLYVPDTYNGKAVTMIAPYAFENAQGLKEAVINKNIRAIGKGAFKGCLDLINIVFEAGSALVSIEDQAFYACSSLEQISLPRNLASIGAYAFAGTRYFDVGLNDYVYRSSLKKVEFDEKSNLETIGDYAFYLCVNLKDIQLPSNVESIGKAAFRQSGLTSVSLEGSQITLISEEAFYGCQSLVNVELPSALVAIQNGAFAFCSNLETVIFTGEGAEYIFDRAFYNCLSLMSVNLPQGLLGIGDEAFKYCAALDYIYIPQNVSRIGAYAFNGCLSLARIEMAGDIAEYIGERAFYDTLWYNSGMDQSEDGVVYLNNIAYSHKGQMQADTVITIKEGVLAISPAAFENLPNLKGIILPSSLKVIGDYAFRNCSSLEFVVFAQDSALKRIGRYAFAQTSLASLELPSNLEIIDKYAFADIASLAVLDMSMAENLTDIEEGAFMNVQALSGTLEIPLSVSNIGKKAFYGCGGLTVALAQGSALGFIGEEAFSYTESVDVVIPQGITVINSAFSNTKITELVIPEHVLRIESAAFKDSLISKIIFEQGSRLVYIGDQAFENLSSTVFEWGEFDQLTAVGYAAFRGCQSITRFLAPNITVIKNNAFEGCSNITDMSVTGDKLADIFGGDIPHTLNTLRIAAGNNIIQEAAFENAASVTQAYFASTVRSIEKNAFKNAENLEFLSFGLADNLYSVGHGAFHNTKWYDNQPQGVICIGNIVYSYKDGDGGIVNIPDGAAAVSAYAFYNSDVRTINLPLSVTRIEEYAFAECKELETVNMAGGSSLWQIGEGAFMNCKALTSIHIPYTVAEIGEYALWGTEALQELAYTGMVSVEYLLGDVPQTLETVRFIDGSTAITAFACQNLDMVKRVIISATVTEIGQAAFKGMEQLSVVNIITGSQLQKIGDYAFEDCQNLTAINLPATAAQIGKGVFAGCVKLEELTVNGSVDFAPLFSDTPSDDCYGLARQDGTYYIPYSLKKLNIAQGSQTIKEGNYQGTQIERVNIPSSVAAVGAYAFEGADKLSVLNISGSGLEVIENDAFSGCESLTEITLPQSLNYIGDRAFYGCSRLATINMLSQSCQTGHQAFYGTLWQTSQMGLVYVGNTLLGYNGILPEDYILTVREGTVEIAPSAFESQNNLVSAVIPSSVKVLNKAAFKNCINLQSVQFTGESSLSVIGDEAFYNTAISNMLIPAAVTSIGDGAFYGCSSLAVVMFDNNSRLRSIGASAFYGSAVSEMVLPAQVKTIGEQAFVNSALTRFRLPDGNALEQIEKSAFQGLEEVEFAFVSLNNLVSIGERAFYGCCSLESFVAPNVEYAGKEAFYGCAALQTLTLPPMARLFELFGDNGETAEFDKIEFENLFYGVPKALKTVYLSDKADKVIDYAFYNCKSMEKAVLPYGITEIGASAFEECHSLQRVVNIDGVSVINAFAFAHCLSLKSAHDTQDIFVLPASIKEIGDYAFINCQSITDFVVEWGSQIRRIGDYAFADMVNTEYDIPDMENPLSVGEGAFLNNKKLTAFNAANVVEIGDGAFSGCLALEKITLCADGFSGKVFGRQFFEDSYQIDFGGEIYYIPQSLTEVTVSKAAASVNDYAFADFVSLQAINLSNACAIGKYAFKNNSSLAAVVIPASVAIIEDGAFEGCYGLEEMVIEFEETLTYIGKNVFEDTAWYMDLTQDINNEIVYIGKVAYKLIGSSSGVLQIREGTAGISPQAFMDKTEITELVLPLSIAAIGEQAFANCYNIATVHTSGYYEIGKLFGEQQYNSSYPASQNGATYYLPQALRRIIVLDGSVRIVDYAFASCVSITSVIIPNSVREIGLNALSGLSALSELTLPASKVLGAYFGKNYYEGGYQAEQAGDTYYLPSALENIVVNSDKICADFLRNASSVKTVTLPAHLKEIGDYAFYGCLNISGVPLPQSLERVGKYAFAQCVSLLSIAFPAGAAVADNALSGCLSLHTVQAKGGAVLHKLFGVLPYEGSYSVTVLNKTYYIPLSLTTVNISSGVVLADYMLYGMSALNTVNLPSDIEEIGAYAFYGLNQLGALTLGQNLKRIKEYAFYDCKKSVINFVQNNVESVGKYAFVNCFELRTFDSPQIVQIGDNAFSGCYRLETLGVTKQKVLGKYFGKQMFVDSYAVIQEGVTYYVPSALKTVKIYGDGALVEDMLADMSKVQSVFMYGVTEICQTAFAGCEGINALAGEDIVYIAEDAIAHLPWLGGYLAQFSNEVVYIGKVAYTYRGVMGIGKIISFREDTTQLYYGAFAGQTRLQKVIVNAQMRHIALTAFYGCSSLADIEVDQDNPYYYDIDGALYDRESQQLIFIPPANN